MTEKSLVNRRFTLKIEAGKATFSLLWSQTTSDSLIEIIEGMIDLHEALETNFIEYSKLVPKPEEPISEKSF